MSELLSSSEYKDKLEDARFEARELSKPINDDPTSLELAKTEAHERAAMLRMEVLFDNASCAESLTQYLEESPNATIDELKQYITENAMLAHPDQTESFIAGLLETRKRVEAALLHIQTLPPIKKENPAQVVYSWVLPAKYSSYTAEGKLSLDEGNPLALTLNVADQEDFRRIDERTNIGGFYNENFLYQRQEQYNGRKIMHFDRVPLIVVNKALDHREGVILGHENRHASQNVFQSTLEKAGKKVVWGGTRKYVADRDANNLVDFWNQEKLVPSQEADSGHDKEDSLERVTRNKDEYWVLIDYALSKVKDEWLAYQSQNDIGFAGNLMTKGGVYDYFRNLADGKLPADLYDELWEDYQARFEVETNVAQEIIDSYSYSGLGLENRKKIFLWVLAQIPMQEWQNQLSRTGFTEEVELFSQLNDKKVILANTPQIDPLWQAYDKFREECQENFNKPLKPFIINFLMKFEE
jgi:hypothetical protein